MRLTLTNIVYIINNCIYIQNVRLEMGSWDKYDQNEIFKLDQRYKRRILRLRKITQTNVGQINI